MENMQEFLTVKQFLAINKGRLGRSMLYERIRDGTIPAVHIGKRKILIPCNALDRLLDGEGNTDSSDSPIAQETR